MWSVTNEPNSNEENALPYFTEVVKQIRSLDDTRPVTGVMCVDVQEDKISQLFDVVCINRYFAWYTQTGRTETIYPMMKKIWKIGTQNIISLSLLQSMALIRLPECISFQR